MCMYINSCNMYIFLLEKVFQKICWWLIGKKKIGTKQFESCDRAVKLFT